MKRLQWMLRLNGAVGATRLATAAVRRKALRLPADEAYCVARDAFFDGRFGVETAGVVEIDSLDFAEELRAHSAEYRPTSSVDAAFTIDCLPINKSAYHFVDIGCGKGRVLVIAGMMPFASVTGVELSPTLAEEARQNLAASLAPQRSGPISVVDQDATDVVLPSGPLVVYLFNPFGRPFVEKLRDRVERTLVAEPRDCWIVYANAVHKSVFESDVWESHPEQNEWWAIYRWRSAVG